METNYLEIWYNAMKDLMWKKGYYNDEHLGKSNLDRFKDNVEKFFPESVYIKDFSDHKIKRNWLLNFFIRQD